MLNFQKTSCLAYMKPKKNLKKLHNDKTIIELDFRIISPSRWLRDRLFLPLPSASANILLNLSGSTSELYIYIYIRSKNFSHSTNLKSEAKDGGH